MKSVAKPRRITKVEILLFLIESSFHWLSIDI